MATKTDRARSSPGTRPAAGPRRPEQSEFARKNQEKIVRFLTRAKRNRELRVKVKAFLEAEAERNKSKVSLARTVEVVRTLRVYRFLRAALRLAAALCALHLLICAVLTFPKALLTAAYWEKERVWWARWYAHIPRFPSHKFLRYMRRTAEWVATPVIRYGRRVLKRALGRAWVTRPLVARTRWRALFRDGSAQAYYVRRYIVSIRLSWGRVHMLYLYFRVACQLLWWVAKVFAFLLLCWLLAFWSAEWALLGPERGAGLARVLGEEHKDRMLLVVALYFYMHPPLYNFWVVDAAAVGVFWGACFNAWRDRRSFALVPGLPAFAAAWVVVPGYYLLARGTPRCGVGGVYYDYIGWWFHQLHPKADFFWWSHLWSNAAALAVAATALACLAPRDHLFGRRDSPRRDCWAKRGDRAIPCRAAFWRRFGEQGSLHFFVPKKAYRDSQYRFDRELMRRADWPFPEWTPDHPTFWQGLLVHGRTLDRLRHRGEHGLLDPKNFGPDPPRPPAPAHPAGPALVGIRLALVERKLARHPLPVIITHVNYISHNK